MKTKHCIRDGQQTSTDLTSGPGPENLVARQLESRIVEAYNQMRERLRWCIREPTEADRRLERNLAPQAGAGIEPENADALITGLNSLGILRQNGVELDHLVRLTCQTIRDHQWTVSALRRERERIDAAGPEPGPETTQ